MVLLGVVTWHSEHSISGPLSMVYDRVITVEAGLPGNR